MGTGRQGMLLSSIHIHLGHWRQGALKRLKPDLILAFLERCECQIIVNCGEQLNNAIAHQKTDFVVILKNQSCINYSSLVDGDKMVVLWLLTLLSSFTSAVKAIDKREANIAGLVTVQEATVEEVYNNVTSDRSIIHYVYDISNLSK